MKRIVLYDVARFINRAKAPTPTGIDRVDIRYLEHFLNQPETQVVGVVQKRGRLVKVPEHEMALIWRLLKDRWIEGRAATADEAREGKRLKLRSTTRSFLSRFWRFRGGTAAERRLDPELLALRAAAPETETLYVNCSHNGIKTSELFEAVRDRLDARLVFYVHDTIPIDFPEYVRSGFDKRHVQRMAIVGRVADRVLTNSGYSRDRFTAFCVAQRIAPPPITVLHIGVEPGFLERAAAVGVPPAQERPYFVAVGTVEPRKNLSMLLRVWQRLRDEGGTVPELRIIGRRGWVTDANRDYEALLGRVAGDVVELDAVGDTALVAQIAGARALLFPSFVEGWGMPLVEALVIGTPAVASDIDAFREAGQGLAELIAPDDIEAWTEAVRRHAAGPVTEAERARIAAFAPPTWGAHFDGLEAALAPAGGTREAAADIARAATGAV